MINVADISAILADCHGPAMECVLHAGEKRIPVGMVLIRGSKSGAGAKSVMGWASAAELPRGADWATALLLAESLPLGLSAGDVDVVDDQLGTLWRVEGKSPLIGRLSATIEGKTTTGVVGWRLALRGTQRGVR